MEEIRRKRVSNIFKTIRAICLIAAVIVASMLITFMVCDIENKGEVDLYAMEKGNENNFEEVYEKIQAGSNDYAKLAEFADWGNYDFSKARSMGSAMTGNTEKKYSVRDELYNGELWVVEDKDEDEAYVFYVESCYSFWGHKNKGVSGIAVTTWDNYYNRSDLWEYKKDGETLRIGKFQ